MQIERKVGGYAVPNALVREGKSEVLEFVVPNHDFLTGGNFIRVSDKIVWSADGKGSVLPGITGEVEARVLGNLVNLLSSGTSRHARAMIVTAAATKNAGKLPSMLLPLVPVGMGDVRVYANAIESTGGWGLRDLCTPHSTGGGLKASAITAEFASHWTWGKLKAHWNVIGRYPGLALPYWPMPMRSMSKIMKGLPKGVHPLAEVPLHQGGGAAEGEMVKSVWAPFFTLGKLAEMGQDVSLADEHRPTFGIF